MIRCRCGTWTNYGMTCAKCAADAWPTSTQPPEDTEESEEEIETVSLDELEELADEDED